MAVHKLKFSKEVEERIKGLKKVYGVGTDTLVAYGLALLDSCTEAEQSGKEVWTVSPPEEGGGIIQRIELPEKRCMKR